MNPGEIIGDLDEKAAKEMGLQQWNQTKGQEKVKVACGLIDAHAGVLGLLATKDIQNIESTLCLIRGAFKSYVNSDFYYFEIIFLVNSYHL